MSLDTVKAPTKVYFIPKTDLEKEDTINLKIAVSGLRKQLETVWNNYIALVNENKKLKQEIRALKAIINEGV